MTAHQSWSKSSWLWSSCFLAVKPRLMMSSLNIRLAGKVLILGFGVESLCHVFFVIKTEILEKSNEIQM